MNGRYAGLKRKYDNLKKKYNILIHKAENIKENIIRDYPPLITSILLFAVGITGFICFKKTLIIELGLIGFFADLSWEILGTEKNRWKYKKSKIFMIRKVPVEIPLLVFSMGLAGATLTLLLLEFFSPSLCIDFLVKLENTIA